MGLRVTTNISSIVAQRSMAASQREIGKSFAQLSSGSRINKAADDAAGLAISESLKSQIRSLSQANRNANDGMSMVQVAEGGLSEISNILTRLRELGIQSASDTIGDRERGYVNKEVGQLKEELQRIAKTTRFGRTNLIDGTGDKFDFQVGINNDEFEDRISFEPSQSDATLSNLDLDGIDFSEKSNAQEALTKIDEAQAKVNGFRANLGALQNRLISTSDNIALTHENISAANSRIRDTDIAMASAELTRNTILLNASNSVLSQANQAPMMALKLLG